MTTIQLEPTPLVLPVLDDLMQEIRETLATYDKAATDLAQRRSDISAAVALAKRRRIRLPESRTEDPHDYDDGGQEVATLMHYRLRQDAGKPRMWLPVKVVLYQWEIPDLTTPLYLTDTHWLTRQIPSVTMTRDAREVLPWDHPSIADNIPQIVAGLRTMRFALHHT